MNNKQIKSIAKVLENMAVSNQGEAALRELLSHSKEDQLAIVKQLRRDAKEENGLVFIANNRLVFNSPFNVYRFSFRPPIFTEPAFENGKLNTRITSYWTAMAQFTYTTC